MEVSTIEQIVKLASNYGIALVLAILLLIILLRDRKKYQDMIMDACVKAINNVLSLSHPSSEEYSKYDIVYATVQALLDKSLQDLHAARISVVMYHNGGQNLVGIPFQKMSMISEAVAPGIARISDEFQAIQRSSYSLLYQQLQDDNYWLITDVNELNSASATHNLLSNHSTSSCIFIKVSDILTESPIGFICIEYLNKQDNFEDLVFKALDLGESVSAILGVKATSSDKETSNDKNC